MTTDGRLDATDGLTSERRTRCRRTNERYGSNEQPKLCGCVSERTIGSDLIERGRDEMRSLGCARAFYPLDSVERAETRTREEGEWDVVDVDRVPGTRM